MHTRVGARSVRQRYTVPLLVFIIAVLTGCGEDASSTPTSCEGVNCGQHGTCVMDEATNTVSCKCDDGYHAYKLFCFVNTDGDYDLDICGGVCANKQCGAASGCDCGACSGDRPYCNTGDYTCLQCYQKSHCPNGWVCASDFTCQHDPGNCTSQASTVCLMGASYYVDSCGNFETVKEQCGATSCEDPYCSGGNVVKDCVNRGCDKGECYEDVSLGTLARTCGSNECDDIACYEGNVVRTCYDRGCDEGACYSRSTRTTYQTCGSNECGDNYCFNGLVVRDCQNRGCKNGACYVKYETETRNDCSVDSAMCGDNFCSDGDVYQRCLVGSCVNAACREDYEDKLVQYCTFNSCYKGACTYRE